MPSIVILIVIIILFNLLNNKNKTKREGTQRPAQRPAPAAQPKPVTAPPAAAPQPERTTHIESDFCQGSGGDEGYGWDSEVESHEGEEFCSPDEHHAALKPVDEEGESELSFAAAQDVVRGVIWSEILTRRKR